jgi:deoxyadenosine/deoxycytidine kinase
MIIISIDGIIGAGKTVFAQHLVVLLKNQGFTPIFVPENVQEWADDGTLKALYAQKLSPAYFQTIVFADKQRLIRAALRKKFPNVKVNSKQDIPNTIVLIVERMHSDSLFMRTNHTLNLVTDLEMKHYGHWHSLWSPMLDFLQADAIVYLKCPLSVCMKRIRERSRSGESLIDTDFQRTLSNIHDIELDKDFYEVHCFQTGKEIQIPILRISTEPDYRDNDRLIKEVTGPVISHIRAIRGADTQNEDHVIRGTILLMLVYAVMVFIATCLLPKFIN